MAIQSARAQPILDASELVAGRYRIQQLIGKGGFGNVYLARDDRDEIRTDLAIKVLSLESARAAQRFRHEARALSTLNHPNIVTVVDVWNNEQIGVLVMEYLNGDPLLSVLTRGPLSALEAIDYMLPVCDALDHAHRRNVIHRDITPGNIILTNGVAKLIDFGFSVSEFSGERARGGTREYAAPEQFQDGARPDPRLDTFGVGAVLYHLLTKRSPPRRAPSALQENLPRLPVVLSQVVTAAIDTNPEQRYQSIQGLIDDLRRARASIASGANDEIPASGRNVISVAPERVPPVGRESALETLRVYLDAARNGRGSVVTVCGPSGSGKSRLVSQFSELVRPSGALVLRGGCLENGRSLPFGALREALAALDGLLREKSGNAGSIVARVLQAARGREGDVRSLAPWFADLLAPDANESRVRPEGEAARKQFLREVLNFFTTLATVESPLMLWLDDVQWIDASTLSVVELLARSIDRHPVFLVLSYRDEGESTIADALGPGQARRAHLPVEPLTRTNVEELLPRIVNTRVESVSDAARLVVDASGGNAFAVWEVCRQLLSAGAFQRSARGEAQFRVEVAHRVLAGITPATLLSKRLAELNDDLRAALLRASVWGPRFTAEHAQLSEENAREAQRLGLITRRGAGEFSFTHDRVRETALAMLPSNDARRLHLAAGEARRDSESTRALAVEHFVAAEALDVACAVALEAAEDADRVLALDTAYALYRRVADWIREGRLALPTAEYRRVLRRCAETALSIGYYRDAFEAFDEWLRAPRDTQSGSAESIARALTYGGQADAQFRLGDVDAAIRLHEKALAELSIEIPRRRLAVLLYIAGQALVATVHELAGAQVLSWFQRADPMTEEAVSRLSAMAFTAYYVDTLRSVAAHLKSISLADRQALCRSKAKAYAQHASLGLAVPLFTARARRYGKEGIKVAATLGDGWTELAVRSSVVLGHFSRARWAELENEISRLEEVGRRVRDPNFIGRGRQHMVYAVYCIGEIPRSIELAREVRAYYEMYDSTTGALDACFFLPQALLATGAVSEAAAIADWHYEGSVSVQDRQGVIQALTQKSLVALARGDCFSAVELSRKACDLAWKHLIQNTHVAEKGAAFLLALAAARRDELPEKRPGWRALARGLAEGAIGIGQGPARRAYNLWALGQALSSFGQSRVSRLCFRAAIRSARAHGTRLDEARAHAALGLSYLTDRRGGEQRISHLTIALDGFQACGATAERETLIRVWRARSPRTSPTPPIHASGSDLDFDTVVSNSSWSTRMNRAVTGVVSRLRS